MVSITIGANPLASNELVPTPTTESGSFSEGDSIERGEALTGDSNADPYMVQVSTTRKHPLGDDFMSHVEKERQGQPQIQRNGLAPRCTLTSTPGQSRTIPD